MKLKGIALIVLGSVCAGCHSPGTMSAHKSEIKNTVMSFVRGGDQRDVAMLQSALHPSFRAVVTFGASGKFTVLTRAQYLKMIKAGKIGGVLRTVNFDAVESYGNIATVRARLVSPTLKFNARYSLVREASRWRLVQDQVVAAKVDRN